MEEPFQDERLEASTFYGLFECEHRRDRLQRLVRVWTGRVARYIRDDDLVNAERLLNSVLENDPYPDEHAETVGKAIERMATPDLLRLLADRNGDEQSAAAEALLTAFGMHVIDQLVTQLAGEDDSRVRRSLTNMLAGAARTKPRALEPYLSDHRWFLVRNLTTALGKTANPDAMGSLRMVLTHSDHRVRTEALRSTVRLMRGSSTPVLVRALSDSHEQVRHTAATLVRGATDDEADRALADELRADRLPADMSIEVISILSERGSASGAMVLEELASRRFAVRAHARAKRRAAREALKGEAQ
jgi:HEAT repeat protein